MSTLGALLWLLAAVAAGAGLGAHRRGRAQRSAGDGSPVLIRLGRRLPAPGALAERASGGAIAADIRTAGLDGVLEPIDVGRASVGWALVVGAPGIVGVVVWPPIGVVALVAAAGAAVVPRRVVRRAAERRRRAITRALPDLIDIVVLSARAGLALEPALRLAARRLGGPVGAEVARMLGLMAFGTPRRRAYRALARGIGGPEVGGLVGALLQAEDLGTPVADVLDRQAELLRAARRQEVRDHAARAAPKVQLIVAMVMVPAALLAIVGVLVIELVGRLGDLSGGM